MDNLLYKIKGTNIVNLKDEYKTEYEYMMKYNRDNNIITMNLEELNYSGSKLIHYINPLLIIGELVFKVDNSNKIINILNYSEVKQRLDDYYTFMIDIKRDSASFIFEVFREELFRTKEKAIGDMLEVDFFYIFNSGLLGTDEIEIQGVIPNKTVPVTVKKHLHKDSIVFDYKIDEEKLDKMLNFEKYNRDLEYEKNFIYLSSDCVIKVDDFGIENVKFDFISGYIDLMERRTKLEIKRVGINSEF